MNKRTIGFSYGALAKTLEEQAREQGFTLHENAGRLEKLKDAIVLLTISALIPDSTHNIIIKKLQKEIVKIIKPWRKK